MPTLRIEPWTSLESTEWQGLLVGNGGSMALHEGFGYRSLLNRAVAAGRLPTTGSLFTELSGGTTNFEHVLLALGHASLVGTILGTPTLRITDAYEEVRNALIDTVNDTHCTYSSVQNDLEHVATFMARFSTVVSLNYDLTVYWAMLEGNEHLGNWFKDGFVGGINFDINWTRLRAPYGAKGATLVFFPHGNLILARTTSGEERKIVASGNFDLLSSISSKWSLGGLAPLFVSEGTAEEKLAAIRRSHYLSIVYDDVLSSFEGQGLVVYGWSFDENDQHIIDRLSAHPPSRMAVSVHNPSGPHAQPFCHRVYAAVKEALPSTSVKFYDAASAWC